MGNSRFKLFGNYMVWGRFLVDAWLKRRTYYDVTNRRIADPARKDGRGRRIGCIWRQFPTIEREGTIMGTLWFAKKYPVIAGRHQKTRSISRFDVSENTCVCRH